MLTVSNSISRNIEYSYLVSTRYYFLSHSLAILQRKITPPSGRLIPVLVALALVATRGGEATEDKAMNSKLIIILIAAISLIGCTSMRTVKSQRSSLIAQLAAGDHLIVYEKSGRKVDMILREIDGDNLEGTLADDSSVPAVVDINDIEKIKVEKIDRVKSTAAVVGATIIILPILAIGIAYRTLTFQPL